MEQAEIINGGSQENIVTLEVTQGENDTVLEVVGKISKTLKMYIARKYGPNNSGAGLDIPDTQEEMLGGITLKFRMDYEDRTITALEFIEQQEKIDNIARNLGKK